jgi:zinc transporter, ZIP family
MSDAGNFRVSQLDKNTDLATMGAMAGFAVMMTLDVALG